MTYAWIQDVPVGEDVYRKIVGRLGDEPLEGLLVHLVLRRPDGKLRYVDVWDSKELCDKAFQNRIHPAVHATFQEIGFRPDGEPPRDELEVVDLRGTLAAGART
ncbi:MAG TPA: hypothetical protein VGX25_06235 [Actinophytocola sp.]|uniref:hypothetical protein n=1 Tax=Actinophytocola sp. TaxID=1872138 RepID=UPI002DDD6F6C|nr:hypothetical protein [Actinophytocola sp.]HEV2778984.1 hypothetical protein [Actinophytocola sp.]